MKRLSMRQAQRCETAKNAKCRCRCGGQFHGKGRGENPDFFKELPQDDPHYAQPKRVPKPRVLKRDRVPPLFEGVV